MKARLVTRRALLVSTVNPYPIVTNGCARLVSDYQVAMFPQYDIYFLLTRPGDWAPLRLFHQGRPIGGELNVQDLLAYAFAFVLFVGFKENEFTRALAGFRPSFCLTDTYPHPDLPDGLFRGVLSHRAGERHRDLLLVGGSYNDGVFYPGFACCKYHFFRMLDNYLWCLRPRGRILTDQRGMDCTVENDPRWQLTFEDLVALERRFPVAVAKVTDTVYEIGGLV
jgi:hypothetical protein